MFKNYYSTIVLEKTKYRDQEGNVSYGCVHEYRVCNVHMFLI